MAAPRRQAGHACVPALYKQQWRRRGPACHTELATGAPAATSARQWREVLRSPLYLGLDCGL